MLVFFHTYNIFSSNCVLAKALLTPGDAEPCFNHNLKHVVDDVLVSSSNPALCPVAALDFLAMGLIIAFIRGSSIIRSQFTSACNDVEVDDLELIAANLTRWEGRFLALQRVLLLRKALQHMLSEGWLAQSILSGGSAFPGDFLTDSYFERLEAYRPVLHILHTVKRNRNQSQLSLECFIGSAYCKIL